VATALGQLEACSGKVSAPASRCLRRRRAESFWNARHDSASTVSPNR
jgi:hypothetical protein